MLKFVKQVFREYSHDKAGQMSAAFAYVSVFAIGPLLLVLVSVVGFIYGQRAAQGHLYSQLSSVVGPDSARTLQHLVAHTNRTGDSVVALIFGIIGLILGAIGLTSQLQNSLDAIFRTVPDPKAGIKFTIYTKLKNILLVGLAAVVAIASIVISAVLSKIGKGIGLEVINNLASWAVFIAVLYLIYRVLPDVSVPRGLVLRASVIVSLLFLVGKIILGFIIGRNGTASAYGAAASLVVLLLWFYYSAQILLLGGEGLKVYGENHKVNFKTKRFAVRLKELDVLTKKDLRGRMVEGFARGYKRKSAK